MIAVAIIVAALIVADAWAPAARGGYRPSFTRPLAPPPRGGSAVSKPPRPTR